MTCCHDGVSGGIMRDDFRTLHRDTGFYPVPATSCVNQLEFSTFDAARMGCNPMSRWSNRPAMPETDSDQDQFTGAVVAGALTSVGTRRSTSFNCSGRS